VYDDGVENKIQNDQVSFLAQFFYSN